jgi:hypothetical protein
MSNICNTITQNQRLLQIQNPPIRLTPINPYLLKNTKTNVPYTTFDLNMRRKTEILKYAPNKQSTQTNNLTKSQKWSQLVSGNFQSQSYNIVNIAGITYLNGQKVNQFSPSIKINGCPQNRSKPTLSTACNVPGEPIYLYEDDSVPLYNYSMNTNSFAIQNEITSPNWYIESYNDVISSITIPYSNINNQPQLLQQYTNPSTIASLYIVSPTYSVTSFSMTIPIGFYLAGDISGNFSGTKYNPMFMDLSGITLTVLNNNNPITFSSLPTYSYYFSPSIFDISINSIMNSNFYIGQYIGAITISNIILPTVPGNVYDFQLSYTLDLYNIPNSQNSILDIVSGYISNITSNTINKNTSSSINTNIPNIPSRLNYKIIQNPSNGFSFTEN